MRSAGSSGHTARVVNQVVMPTAIADRAPVRFAFFHHTPMMNGTMMAARPSMFESTIRVKTTLIFKAQQRWK